MAVKQFFNVGTQMPPASNSVEICFLSNCVNNGVFLVCCNRIVLGQKTVFHDFFGITGCSPKSMCRNSSPEKLYHILRADSCLWSAAEYPTLERVLSYPSTITRYGTVAKYTAHILSLYRFMCMEHDISAQTGPIFLCCSLYFPSVFRFLS